ncbi:MAG: hypothetical protein ROR55_03370 [Devosia sp.]
MLIEKLDAAFKNADGRIMGSENVSTPSAFSSPEQRWNEALCGQGLWADHNQNRTTEFCPIFWGKQKTAECWGSAMYGVPNSNQRSLLKQYGGSVSGHLSSGVFGPLTMRPFSRGVDHLQDYEDLVGEDVVDSLGCE